MKATNRLKLLSIILVFAYLLSACSGAAPQSNSPTGSGKPQSMEVAFTGTVESVSAGQITISGQTVTIDAKTMLDPNIKVGDIVKVEAQVSDTGAVLALKVESFGADDTNTNSNVNANDNSTNANDNTNANTNDNSNASNDNVNGNVNSNDNTNTAGGTAQEIVGVVDAFSSDSVTVDGVVYQITSLTEFKDAIFAGDTVKLHVIVNADGSLTVREIEKFSGTTVGDDNSNSNGNDDHGNSNGNSNDDDDDDDNSNSNSNANSNGDD